MDFRIMIAEDEPQLREILCDYFRSKGDIPVEAATAQKRWRCRRLRNSTRCCWTS